MVRSRTHDVAAAFFFSAITTRLALERAKQIPDTANSRVRDDNFDGLLGWRPQNQVLSG
jgi:hypothetical protein